LGGHANRWESGEWYMVSYEHEDDPICSSVVLPVLKNLKSELFMVIDGCHSGAMIDNIRNYPMKSTRFTVLCSTQADNSAETGWSLV